MVRRLRRTKALDANRENFNVFMLAFLMTPTSDYPFVVYGHCIYTRQAEYVNSNRAMQNTSN